jgi:hypothetical protein
VQRIRIVSQVCTRGCTLLYVPNSLHPHRQPRDSCCCMVMGETARRVCKEELSGSEKPDHVVLLRRSGCMHFRWWAQHKYYDGLVGAHVK